MLELASGITVIIPAHNERQCIGETLASVLDQTMPPDLVVVVDDFSDDGTGEYVTQTFPSVKVLRPEWHAGCKAFAQNYALFYRTESGAYLIDTPVVVTLDADTTLERNSLEEISRPIREDNAVKAVCGLVIPIKNLDNPFTLGRLGEYLYAFFLPKKIQQAWGGKISVVSGCFGCFAIEPLRARGGWYGTTLAEDMELTADYHGKGYRLAYNHRAHCHPIEPYNWRTYRTQMQRWSAGFFQNVSIHRRTYGTKLVGVFIGVSFLDALMSGIIYPLAPLWMVLFGWYRWLSWFLVWDMAIISAPILIMGTRLRVLKHAVKSIPFVFFLRLLNIWFWFRALFLEWIARKPLTIYVKGH